MTLTAGQAEHLRMTLAGRRVLPYCDALTVACFDLGLSLAQAGADLPVWLGTAPRWARAAVAIGRSAGLRVIEEDRVLARATAEHAQAMATAA